LVEGKRREVGVGVALMGKREGRGGRGERRDQDTPKAMTKEG